MAKPKTAAPKDKTPKDTGAAPPLSITTPAPLTTTELGLQDWVEPFPARGMVHAHVIQEIRVNGQVLPRGKNAYLPAEVAHALAHALTAPK